MLRYMPEFVRGPYVWRPGVDDLPLNWREISGYFGIIRWTMVKVNLATLEPTK